MSLMQTERKSSTAPTIVGGPAPVDDRRPAITPVAAGWFGAGLAGSALVGVILVNLIAPGPSLASSALTGTAVLSVGLVALIVFSRAVGTVQPSAALGLPNGSVRALLALGLAIVFVSVASWTLGGLFDPLGQQITSVKIPTTQVQAILDQYRGDFIVGRNSVPGSSPPEEIVKVFIKRTAQTDGSLDLAKQILTIAATVLVTVVGFYFGSNASSDAVRNMQAGLFGRSPGSTASPFDAAMAVAREIANVADEASKRTAALDGDPIAKLADAVRDADAQLRDRASKLLGDAQQRLLTLKDAQSDVSDAAAQAARIATSLRADASDGDLQVARDGLTALRTKMTDAVRTLDAAIASFVESRDAVLAAIAKG